MKSSTTRWTAARPTALLGLLLAAILPTRASTVAYWRFEQGPADGQMVHLSGVNGTWSADVADSSGNGNALSVWTGEAWAGYVYKWDVAAATIPQTGADNGFSVKNSGGYPGMWCNTLRTWTPAAFTVEATFKLESGGYKTIVGRDSRGAGPNAAMAALYFQKQDNESVAIKFQDVSGYQYTAASAAGIIKGFTYSTDPDGLQGKWYAMAGLSDGKTLSLYLNDVAAGEGYKLVAQTDLTLQGSPNTALTAGLGSGGDWTAGDFSVGRGLYNGAHTDRAYGFIDEVRLSDTALAPNQFLFATASETEVRGTVTDFYTGAPVPGATVTIGPYTDVTDSTGSYSLFSKPGNTYPITISAYYAEDSFSSSVTYPAAGFVTKDAKLHIRPHGLLHTANGYSWKALLNTGGDADYSAKAADETAFVSYTVPSSWNSIDATDDIYGWIRLHFDLPAGFLTAIPGRAVRLHVYGGGIDDVNKTWLNGTPIGEAGKFPNPALPVMPAGHTNPPIGVTYAMSYLGVDLASGEELIYTFPASLLTATDNVLAIKCFDFTGGGGVIAGNVALEIAPPTGAVTGTVKMDNAPVAGARVAVSDATGLSSAWGWTDGTGTFSLPFAAAGPGVVGVTKLGMNSIIKPVTVGANGSVALNLTTTAVSPALDAPIYDNFDDNAGSPTWQEKWWAVALDDNSNPADTPAVLEPGYDINQGQLATIPSTVTVYQTGNGRRSSIISKSRFSRFASVNEAKLVSARGPATSTDDWGMNTILNLNGNAAEDPSVPTPGILFPYMELDIEGWGTDGIFNIVQWIAWEGNGGALIRRSSGIVPLPLTFMSQVNPSVPATLAINRTGSIYDFYIGGTLVHSEYNAIAMPDHRIAMYGYHILSENTWDYVAAAPIAGGGVKGDINANGVLDFSDVVSALRIAGGLDTATAVQVTAGNQAGSDSVLSVLDAVRLSQALGGKAL